MDNIPYITMQLKGPRGPADLDDFAVVISTLRNSVKNVARCITGHEDFIFDVTHLEYSSAIVDVSPIIDSEIIRQEIATVYEGTISAIQGKQSLDPRIDWAALYSFRGYSNVAKKPGALLKIGHVPIGKAFADGLAAILEPDIQSYGSVTGRLEGFSIHVGNRFTLYPPVPGESVECVFDRESLPKVLSAVDNIVTVYGKMHYAKTKAFPVKCEVESFEVVTVPDALPTLLNACGSLRSTVSSDQTIRELRNEW